MQDGAAEVCRGDGNARDGGEGENAGKVLGKASCDPNMMGKTEEKHTFPMMKVGRQSQGCVLALRGGPWPGAVQDES